jgi:hypothetical protein
MASRVFGCAIVRTIFTIFFEGVGLPQEGHQLHTLHLRNVLVKVFVKCKQSVAKVQEECE